MIELTDENSTNSSGRSLAKTCSSTSAPLALTSTTGESAVGVRRAMRASRRMPGRVDHAGHPAAARRGCPRRRAVIASTSVTSARASTTSAPSDRICWTAAMRRGVERRHGRWPGVFQVDSGGSAVRPTSTSVGAWQLLAMCSATARPMPPRPPVITYDAARRPRRARGPAAARPVRTSAPSARPAGTPRRRCPARRAARARVGRAGRPRPPSPAAGRSTSTAIVATWPSSRGITRTAPWSMRPLGPQVGLRRRRRARRSSRASAAPGRTGRRGPGRGTARWRGRARRSPRRRRRRRGRARTACGRATDRRPSRGRCGRAARRPSQQRRRGRSSRRCAPG